MPGKLKLCLTAEQLCELEQLRDHAPKPYLREQAAAILKIAEGYSGHQVALHRLLKRHAPDTIYAWVRDYLTKGKAGLEIKAGCGRKPAFSPATQTGNRRMRPYCTFCTNRPSNTDKAESGGHCARYWRP